MCLLENIWQLLGLENVDNKIHYKCVVCDPRSTAVRRPFRAVYSRVLRIPHTPLPPCFTIWREWHHHQVVRSYRGDNSYVKIEREKKEQVFMAV